MTALPAEILSICVADETSQEMPWLKSYRVEIQSEYGADARRAWSDRLIEQPVIIIDGVRFEPYGVAFSGPYPLDMTITLYTMGEEQPGDWARLALKWAEQYGERYHSWRPNNGSENKAPTWEMV